MAVDPCTPCIIGVATHTWRGLDAPEPLIMWAEVARAAAADSGAPTQAVLDTIDSLTVTYCQTWQYDDAAARLGAELGIAPSALRYTGIGGTVPQQVMSSLGEAMVRGEHDVALVVSAEALATQRAWKQRGERYPYRYKPAEKRPFPLEAPLHPAEVAHEVFQAWLTFALFDSARRARLGVGLDEYRRSIAGMLAPLTEIAAANPDAWFPQARPAEEILVPTAANRMVGYPYTKYMVSVMDVDMAAAFVVATHAAADRLGVPQERRVYLRGWSYATDAVYVAEHADLASSPAMRRASARALAMAGAGIDDVAHLDLYSCFASSLHFAGDALGLAPSDARPLSVTGGLPYHGGPGSGYMTHSIAAMARVLRDDPGTLGLVSGVGMHMTKHAFGVYSTTAGALDPVGADLGGPRPEEVVPIVERYEGEATVAAYSVVHGRDGAPASGVLVCDVPGGRAYAVTSDAAVLETAETTEMVGRPVRLRAESQRGPLGDTVKHFATVE